MTHIATTAQIWFRLLPRHAASQQFVSGSLEGFATVTTIAWRQHELTSVKPYQAHWSMMSQCAVSALSMASFSRSFYWRSRRQCIEHTSLPSVSWPILIDLTDNADDHGGNTSFSLPRRGAEIDSFAACLLSPSSGNSTGYCRIIGPSHGKPGSGVGSEYCSW